MRDGKLNGFSPLLLVTVVQCLFADAQDPITLKAVFALP